MEHATLVLKCLNKFNGILVEIDGSCFPNVSINKIKLGISVLGCQNFGGILPGLENLKVWKLLDSW